jgi:hypothetical protein
MLHPGFGFPNPGCLLFDSADEGEKVVIGGEDGGSVPILIVIVQIFYG